MFCSTRRSRSLLCLCILLTAALLPSYAVSVQLGPRLQKKLAEPNLPLASKNAQSKLRLIVSGDDTKAFLQRLQTQGIDGRLIGDVGRIDISAAQLRHIPGEEHVQVDLGRRYFPLLDESAPTIGVDSDLRMERTGKDVVVAILDTGVDFAHPSFLNGDGSTRFVAYWDQTYPEGGTGTICWANDINDGSCPNNADEPIGTIFPNGHGTHVAGIAAGNATTYTGIASDAMLVGVRLTFEEAGLIDALEWVAQLADQWQKPMVANLSLGSNEGAHNGLSPSEVVIDTLGDAGTMFVVAGGNEGSLDAPIHAAASLTQSTRFRFSVSPFATQAGLEVWSQLENDVQVAIAIEEKQLTTVGDILVETDYFSLGDGGTTVTMATEDEQIATVQFWPTSTTDGTVGLRAEIGALEEDISDYRWQIALRGEGVVDAWLTDRSATFETAQEGVMVINYASGETAEVLLVEGDNYKTITLPGTARQALTISGYVIRTSWTNDTGDAVTKDDEIGELLTFASLGPTGDGRVKPELTAPGGYIGSALATTLSFFSREAILDDHHAMQRGTSMAAPHASGAAALILEGQPDLTMDAIKEAMIALAKADDDTGAVPNDDWGYGKLSVAGISTHAIWSQSTTDQVAPALSNIQLAKNGSSLSVVWQTNELADSYVETDKGEVFSTSSFTENHTIEVHDPGSHVRIRSRDPRGNAAFSAWIDVPQVSTGCGCHTAAPGDKNPWFVFLIALMLFCQYIFKYKERYRGSEN